MVALTSGVVASGCENAIHGPLSWTLTTSAYAASIWPVGYRQIPLWLNPDEFNDLVWSMR